VNLDDELRDTLRTRAGDGPSGAGMLERVRATARRSTMRRRVGGVGAATGLAGALAVGVAYLPIASGQPAPFVPGGTVAESTATPSAVPAAPTVDLPTRSTVELVPGFAPLTFPLKPGWTPPGLGEPAVSRAVGTIRLVYLGRPSSTLIAAISDELVPTDWHPATTRPTTVGSLPATATGATQDGQPVARIAWQLRDKRWATVDGTGLTAAEVERYADNLGPGNSSAGRLPLTPTLAPKGFQVAFQEVYTPGQGVLCLAAPNEMDGESHTWVCIRERAADTQGKDSGAIRIGENGTGNLVNSGEQVVLTVRYPEFEFEVATGRQGPLNMDDLIRFAAGINKS
jgi:hypothetical protein